MGPQNQGFHFQKAKEEKNKMQSQYDDMQYQFWCKLQSNDGILPFLNCKCWQYSAGRSLFSLYVPLQTPAHVCPHSFIIILCIKLQQQLIQYISRIFFFQKYISDIDYWTDECPVNYKKDLINFNLHMIHRKRTIIRPKWQVIQQMRKFEKMTIM